ncbi:MAG TPA: hypothetical protein VKS82_22855 [Streptosporangiaceae bacterium]|nr:hypothetical protein [Streptosporangiaceae bacterium]
MTATSPAAEPPARGERITVTLIPKAEEDLRRLQERTQLSKTDLANRAISLYKFFDDQIRTGHDLIARDNQTGTTKLVHLVDAPVLVAKPARLAWYRRNRTGGARRPHPSHARPHRPVIAARLLVLASLVSQEARTR